MRKILAVVLILLVAATMFSVTAFAATNTVEYYDENGNPIVVNGLYYNSQGNPMYNASCYYLDENGDPVYVGGCRAYYYDQDGNLSAGNHYYDQNGNAIDPPASYPGGYGCGAWYYNAQGGVVNQAAYYDDFGNPVDPPADVQPPANRSGGYYGNCCAWRYYTA